MGMMRPVAIAGGIKVLFVKSPLIGSRLIRWGLDEDCSHVIISFLGNKNAMFHSYGGGLQALDQRGFDQHKYILVDSVTFPMSPENETVARSEFWAVCQKYSYDKKAFLFFAWRALLKKLFNIPFPKENKFNERASFLCTEGVYLAAQLYAQLEGKMILPDGYDLAMTSPRQLCELLKIERKKYD